ncbi:MAG: hypothetical protein KDE56_31970, partial [Anaerolineales bacterium]|nr:hypothetical protein [Anaerolineales bacterium]
LFTERAYTILTETGRLGYVIPSGIYSDLGTKELREMLLNEGRIEYLYNFSNERFFFPEVHHSFKFTLLGAQKGAQSDGFWATFRFNPRVAVRPDELAEFLSTHSNLVFIKRDSIGKFSPDSLSVMEFQSQIEVDLAEKMYGEHGTLGETRDEVWNMQFGSEFHMTSARELFQEIHTGIPLYEGKSLHQFTLELSPPRYWLSKSVLKNQYYRIAVRAIARTTDIRTLISAIIPPSSGAGNSLLTTKDTLSPQELMYCLSILNSYALDFVIRQKIATNINMFFLYQLPVPRLQAGNKFFDAIVPRAAALTCTTPAFADLWEAVMPTPWQMEDRPQTTDHKQPSSVVGRPSSVL